MIWKRLFGSSKNAHVEGGPTVTASESSEVDRILESAFIWLDETTAGLHARGLGSFTRWDASLAEGTITFSAGDGKDITFGCQAVGTFNPSKGTWHWGWDHPTIPASSAGSAEAVRDFGVINNLDAFTTRQIEADQRDAWQFAGLAGLLTNATGVYRCPGEVEAYLTLYDRA